MSVLLASRHEKDFSAFRQKWGKNLIISRGVQWEVKKLLKKLAFSDKFFSDRGLNHLRILRIWSEILEKSWRCSWKNNTSWWMLPNKTKR